MSFSQSFYNLIIESSVLSSGTNYKFKIKTVGHPEETATDICARILIYALNYTPELKMSAGFFEPDIPTAYEKDFTDSFTSCYFWQLPEIKVLKKYWALTPCVRNVYFADDETFHSIFKLSIPQITKINEGANFFKFDAEFLELCATHIKPSSHINLSLIEEILYISIDNFQSETTIQQLDLLTLYQLKLDSQTITQPAT